MAPVYCQAVLCYDQRIALDGSPAETVDAEAKDLATKRREAVLCPQTANPAQDAGAIARPGACCAVAPARLTPGAAPRYAARVPVRSP
jgi:hypothetical protein